ncbi:MAG: hypothetical protein IH944_04310 [Armatimonadetes bacterium]|nr:hypothetical protein [Armatimonadota bacterium]
MRELFFSLVVVSLLTASCKNETEPVAAMSDFTGKWEGHTVITDEDLDTMHETFPEGDREVLERTMRRNAAMIVWHLKLNADGTVIFGIVGIPAFTMSQGTWELSEDRESITVSKLSGGPLSTTTSVQPVTGEERSTEEITPRPSEPVMSLKIAEDGQSLTDTVVQVGKLVYTRPGTVATETPVPDDPYTYAASGEVADFVGEWSMWFDMDARWDDMRGVMSEADVQIMKEDSEFETGGVHLMDDMTFRWFGDDAPEGMWAVSEEGASVFLKVSVSEEAAALMDATELDALTMELRLTEDRTTLVPHDSAGNIPPIMILKRK